MTKKYDNIIAIDPDVKKSGVAYLKTATAQLEVTTLTFPSLVDYLQYASRVCENTGETSIVLVEAGWANKSHWHVKRGDNARQASAKGNSTGRNHEVGRKIVEICKHYGLEVVEHPPLRKCWKGKDGKITHGELVKLTGIAESRTNQEERDAALLAWNYAGLK